ncbi:hypothetical protein LOK82_13155 [Xylella fastidiosa subsp. multiplex]|uniref:Uncharacterized protein n=1 Tax=Xylella fastidiosa subsp. multiplex TaxID=644357 RepID=A0AAW6HXL9_XYLFS|nr:hypothetical protein [Xylella fastidiosa subsp. multiplex]
MVAAFRFPDEFWKLLNDPAFEDLAQNKLVTIRNKTDSLSCSRNRPSRFSSRPCLRNHRADSNKNFPTNPEADYDDYVNGFKLTEREFEIVKSLGEKSRQFLIKQGQNSVVAELNLRGSMMN